MKQIVRYSGTKSERMYKALLDCKFYLGQELYDKVMATLHKITVTEGKRAMVRTGYFSLGMLGIEGAPARAMMLQALREVRN